MTLGNSLVFPPARKLSNLDVASFGAGNKSAKGACYYALGEDDGWRYIHIIQQDHITEQH